MVGLHRGDSLPLILKRPFVGLRKDLGRRMMKLGVEQSRVSAFCSPNMMNSEWAKLLTR